MLRAGLVGVSGYTGMELVRLLVSHPDFTLTMATSRQEAGKKIEEIYPFMLNLEGGDITICDATPQMLKENCDIVFLAVPHGVAMNMTQELLDAGCKVVDLSADFRLNSPSIFKEWYKTEHTAQGLLKEAVYGLPELYAHEISKARLVANPGCYPTASILGLYPALEADLIEKKGIVIDAKSGSTGAGRKTAVNSLFCEVHDNFKAYSLTTHRHTPEIEQELSKVATAPIVLSFNPHLVPMNRGILATIYTQINKQCTLEEIYMVYTLAYRSQPFVRVLPLGQLPETKNVRGTMFCDIGLSLCERTHRLIITSAIDNLSRGASAQALANANLMCGLSLTQGLNQAPMMP